MNNQYRIINCEGEGKGMDDNLIMWQCDNVMDDFVMGDIEMGDVEMYDIEMGDIVMSVFFEMDEFVLCDIALQGCLITPPFKAEEI